jgi:hypothetical protein
MKKMTLLALFAIVLVNTAAAQDQKMWFSVHEDLVIPSKNEQYVSAMKALKEACLKHQVAVSWVTVRHDDNSYIHLSPIKNFADLDKDYFGDLKKKIGDEAFGKLMNAFSGCHSVHSDFVVEQMPSHSYMAPPENETFRDVLYWNVHSGKEIEAEKILMEWKKLYEAKKAPNGFLAFKTVFGRAPGFAIVSWGKDPVDAATKDQKTMELIGKDAEDLIKRTMAITEQMLSKRAWVMADYSIMPPAPSVATKK